MGSATATGTGQAGGTTTRCIAAWGPTHGFGCCWVGKVMIIISKVVAYGVGFDYADRDRGDCTVIVKLVLWEGNCDVRMGHTISSQ